VATVTATEESVLMSKRAKALAGALIKAKVVKDAQAERELWIKYSLWREHFILGITQALVHERDLDILTVGLMWACEAHGIHHKKLTKAARALGLLNPPRAKRRRKG
jgi:hypothetical protein